MKAKRKRSFRREPKSGPISELEIRRTTPMAARFLIFFTVIAWLAYLTDQVRRVRGVDAELALLAEAVVYAALVTSLTISALAYLVARLGHLKRRSAHRSVPRVAIDDAMDAYQPSVTVLIPSYREDEAVVRQTLLSAALQEYPDLRMVLLIDDPPEPKEPAHRAKLEAARDLPHELNKLLSPRHELLCSAMHRFDRANTEPGSTSPEALVELASLYRTTSGWIMEDARAFLTAGDHVDLFLHEGVVGRLVDDLQSTASALEDAASATGARISRQRTRQLHRRLTWIYDTDVWSFERKTYSSLSHEPNKAMNLNSYLSLMGRRMSIESSPGARVLVDDPGGSRGVEVVDTDYVLTLDADSILMPEYCLRLIHQMEQPEFERVAVVQTPYSAFPNPSSPIERIAGATTDVQFIVHQGLTLFGATFWVGANAIIRKTAIDELRSETVEEGFEIVRFIADRTVIEDTESSVALRNRGWQLYNYPERMSYSATPPDFGSMVVQRKRWANGGLLVLGELRRLWSARGEVSARWTEMFLRFSYLASIAWVSLGLTVLLLFPFRQQLLSPVAVLTALPYFVATAVDLRRIGYRASDVFGVYALNLLLLPVNLAGTVTSLLQAIGGHKVDFARTPKVKGRTAAPLWFIVAPVLLFFWSLYTLARDLDNGFYTRALFAGTNALAFAYAFIRFIGPINAAADVLAGLHQKVMVPVTPPRVEAAEVPAWAAVLFVDPLHVDNGVDAVPVALALSVRDQMLTNPSGPFRSAPIALGAPASSGDEPPVDVDKADPEVDQLIDLRDGGTVFVAGVGQ